VAQVADKTNNTHSSRKPCTKDVPKILLTNARSISNKFDELCNISNHCSPDLIVVTESWLESNTPSDIYSITNYEVLRKDRDSYGGGIIVWSRYKCHIIEAAENDSSKSEVLVFTVEYFKVFILVLYHPYWGNVKEHENTLNYIQHILDTKKPHGFNSIICGDFNDLRFKLKNFEISNSLSQLVKVPTRKSEILDLIYVPTSLQGRYNTAEVKSPLGRSDHNVILLTPRSKTVHRNKIKIRDFSSKNMAKFGEMLVCIDWNKTLPINSDIDIMTNNYNLVLFSLYDKCFPLKTVTLSSDDQPWTTPKIKLLMAQKDRAFHKGQHMRYVSYREHLIRELESSKKKFFASIHSKRSPWDSINKIVRNKSRRNEINETQAENLNSNFSDVFLQRSATFKLNDDNLPINLTIMEHEVALTIASVKSNTCGPDNISGSIYKKFSTFLAYPLSIIFNSSLQQKKFPSCWKQANIVPVPKGKGEFRPISLLPFPSKVFEKIVLRNLLLPNITRSIKLNQHGFIPKRSLSTTTAVTLLKTDAVNKLTSKGGYIRCLAIDFCKAFDRVSHEHLIQQALFQLNFSPQICLWLESYLSNRKQRVIYGDAQATSWKECTSGVPQGSVIGPVLFCILMNSYEPLHSRSKVILYADDLTLLHYVSPNDVDNTNHEIKHLLDWCSKFCMTINTKKTKLLNISLAPRIFQPISMHDSTIEPVETLKLLGVTICSSLSSKEHGLQTLKKCAKGMAMVRKLKCAGIQNEALWLAYLSFVRCHMAYCWPSVCDMPQSVLKKYNIIEKQASLICNTKIKVPLNTQLTKLCINLMNQIGRNKNHPLRSLFNEQFLSNYNLRSHCPLVPVNRSTRVMKCFPKFYCSYTT